MPNYGFCTEALTNLTTTTKPIPTQPSGWPTCCSLELYSCLLTLGLGAHHLLQRLVVGPRLLYAGAEAGVERLKVVRGVGEQAAEHEVGLVQLHLQPVDLVRAGVELLQLLLHTRVQLLPHNTDACSNPGCKNSIEPKKLSYLVAFIKKVFFLLWDYVEHNTVQTGRYRYRLSGRAALLVWPDTGFLIQPYICPKYFWRKIFLCTPK